MTPLVAIGVGYTAAFLLPLVLAVLVCLPHWRHRSLACLMMAPLPALLLSVLVDAAVDVRVEPVLFGMCLAMDQTARIFLLFTSLVWLAAAVHAGGYLGGQARSWVFAVFFLAAMAGNFGLILAQDAVSFYAFFSLMSFAAFGLVVHQLTPFARRAALVYIVMVIAAETLLLPAMLMAAGEAGSASLADLRQALASSPDAPLIVLLLLAGFAIKAGIMPLHFWLPLAHPAAPTPASAVLSGCMIKAGVFGWIRFLPLGEMTLPAAATAAVAAGILTILLGSVLALAQSNPKALLAYSSVSKMGLLIVLIGLTLLDAGLYPLTLPAMIALCCFHALNKGALFLGCSITPGSPPAGRWGLFHKLLLSFAALVFAGFPAFAGALAKLPMKELLQSAEALGTEVPWFLAVTSASALLTALVMIRFVSLTWPGSAEEPAPGALQSRAAWYGLLTVLAGYPLLLQLGGVNVWTREAMALTALWSGLWPILVAAGVAVGYRFLPARVWSGGALGRRFHGLDDLLSPTLRHLRDPRSLWPAPRSAVAASVGEHRPLDSAPAEWLRRMERQLNASGPVLFLVLLFAMAAAVLLS